MKKLIQFFVFILLLSSCDQKSDEPNFEYTSYDEICEILDNALSTGKLASLSEVESFAKTLSGYTKIEENNGSIYIYFKDGQRYFIDLEGSSQIDLEIEGKEGEIDDLIEQLESLIGYNYSTEEETKPLGEHNLVSRSEDNTSASLMTRRDILLWSPMQLQNFGFLAEFEKLESSLRKKFPNLKVTKVYENGKQTASTLLNSFELFSNYNLVFVVISGEIN